MWACAARCPPAAPPFNADGAPGRPGRSPSRRPTATSPDDIAAVKRVIEAARKGKEADADAAEKSIADPVARKLAEWVILRSDNTKPTSSATPPS